MRSGDVVVADRGFCSYVHLAMLQSKGIHAVFRLHQHVRAPFDQLQQRPSPQQGKRRRRKSQTCVAGKLLGEQDQLVTWRKSRSKPGWISGKDFEALPATLHLRVLRYRVNDSGCRTHLITLVTTLLDPIRYTKSKLARLFAICCRVEGDLRDSEDHAEDGCAQVQK